MKVIAMVMYEKIRRMRLRDQLDMSEIAQRTISTIYLSWSHFLSGLFSRHRW